MLAGVMSIRTRRREQSVQEDIDVAHGEAVIVSNKVERVVEHAVGIRQMGFLELLVLGTTPKGSISRARRPSSRLRRAAMHQSSPRG